MAIRRREFIKFSALVSASALVPDFLKAFGNNFNAGAGNGKTLVVVQLSGGNDGLNCVVPFRNDLYYKARPSLGLQKDELILLDDQVGLNANLQGLADLYNDGSVAIINSVGYPNPNRSHFRSTDIWQSASDENQIVNTGWIGRYLDSNCNGECAKPHTAVEIDDTLSLALKGEKTKGLAFREPKSLQIFAANPMIRNVASHYHEHEGENPSAAFLNKTLGETTQSADYIYEHSKVYKSKRMYPQHEFGKRMKTIAELICSGSETKIYYVSLSGFDTHVLQSGQHGRVLKVYSDSLKAFCDDLKEQNRFDETMVLTFSEFGRRVEQNSGKGTDHGTANNVYIVGGKLSKAGVINDLPDLQNLDDGDLIYKVDFRQVYATLLDKFLAAESQKILNNQFASLNFI
jgi:uncharacterized protein (DUF1501 family)